MTTTRWDPEAGPKISKAWHAIRDCLDLNGTVDHQTLLAVATSTGIVEKTADNLLRELRNHGYISRRSGVYTLRPRASQEPATDPKEHERSLPSSRVDAAAGAARVARYAEAIQSAYNLDTEVSVQEWDERVARAVMAVADEERAADRAEVDRLRAGGSMERANGFLARAEAAEAEVAHWKHHAWESGEGFKRAIESERRAWVGRRAAEARHDALVADLRGLADNASHRSVYSEPGMRAAYRDVEADLRAVLDKHAGEQAQGGEGS